MKSKQGTPLKLITEITSILDIAKKPTKPKLEKLLPWAQKISVRPHLYCPTVQEDHKTNHYYRIVFQSLHGLEANSLRKKFYIQFSCILFNLSTLSYASQTYFSQMLKIQQNSAERVSLDCQKSIYVYTSLQNIILKVDVWRLQSQKNKNGFEAMIKRTFLGHLDLDLTQSNQTGRMTKKLNLFEEEKFFPNELSQEDEEQQKLILKKKYTKITYQVLNTHSLAYLHVFMPPSVICDQNDTILGLKNQRISEQGELLLDQRSKLRFQIEQVNLPKTAIKNIIQIANDKISLSYPTARPVCTLKQVILHIEFHNGWKSISQTRVVLKQKELLSQQMSPSKMLTPSKNLTPRKIPTPTKKSLKQTSKINQQEAEINKIYYFDKVKQLSAVFSNPGGCLIIWLQAKVEIKMGIIANEQKKQKNQIIYMPIGFALKSIDNKQDQKLQLIQLQEGNPFNISHLLQYLTQLKQPKQSKQSKITCELMFYLINSKEGLYSIGKDTLERDTQQIAELKIEKERLTRLRRKLKEEKRKKMIEYNQEIPFLDPSKLKEQLYSRQLQKMKEQTQEKEQILFYLKNKVNKIEREVLSQNYKNAQDIEELGASRSKLIQKMPELFIDHKPEQKIVSLSQGLSIDIFTPNFNKKVLRAPLIVPESIVADFMQIQTYLNIKILHFQSYRQQIDSYVLLVYDLSGKVYQMGPLDCNYKEENNLSVNIPIFKQSLQLTHNFLNSLANGFLPVYLQSIHFPKLIAIGLLDMGALFDSLQPGAICYTQSTETTIFKQEQTELGSFKAIVSFTQSYSAPQLSQLQQNFSMQISSLIRDKQSSVINRINRYKQQQPNYSIESSKAEVIQKIISKIPKTILNFYINQGSPHLIKLQVTNSSNHNKSLKIQVMDEDEKYLEKPQIQIVYKSAQRQNSELLMTTFKSKNIIEIKASTRQLLLLNYLSQRKILSPYSPYHRAISSGSALLKQYNHPHKITVTLIEPDTNIVDQIFQLKISPLTEPNSLFLQTFITEGTEIVLPISTKGLQVQSSNVKITPTRAIISQPALNPSEWSLTQFALTKTLPNQKQSITFQNIDLLIWQSYPHHVELRLWQQQDLLLKISFLQILKKQISLGYPIEYLKVESKHVDLQIRSNSQFQYETTLGVNRKANQVFVRSKLHCKTIGKQIYPVEISDQQGKILYRISVATNVVFPSLLPKQVISIKIPKQHLEQEESFSYQNTTDQPLSLATYSLKPNLLRIKQKNVQVPSKESAQLSLKFNWQAIISHLREQQKEECQLLIGVSNNVIIDYFLFRCKSTQ